MFLQNFRTYQFAKKFYLECRELKQIPSYLRDHLLRASSSVCLNLAEGYGRRTSKDQAKFYSIALGSIRECQAIIDLDADQNCIIAQSADIVAAQIYSLLRKYNSR